MKLPQISYAALIESLTLVIALLAYCTAMTLGISISSQIYLTVAFLCVLLLLCWRSTRGGMHPCFLFLGLLLLFQGGRLLSFCLPGSEIDPMELASANGPFDVTLHAQRVTLLVIVLSAVCMYLPVRLSGSQVNYKPLKNLRLVPYVLGIFLLTLPFLIWKNYQYLTFVRSHGGYIAIYLAHDELVAQAGTLVRILSRICSVAFLVYFCYERPSRRLALVAFVYFGVTIMELVIGLRGDVMLALVVCIFLWELKRGTHFKIGFLLVMAVILALLGQIVAGVRGDNASSYSITDMPRLFLYSQGTSMVVTEAVVSSYGTFVNKRANMLSNDIVGGFPLLKNDPDETLASQVSIYIDPFAYKNGYALGTTYIAESYLFYKYFGVIAISLILSIAMIVVSSLFHGYWSAYSLFAILSIVYLPRAGIVEELMSLLNNVLLISMILMCAWIMLQLKGFAMAGIRTSNHCEV